MTPRKKAKKREKVYWMEFAKNRPNSYPEPSGTGERFILHKLKRDAQFWGHKDVRKVRIVEIRGKR